MTVIFCLLVIGCGFIGFMLLFTGSIVASIPAILIAILSVLALIGRIKAEQNLASMNHKQSEPVENMKKGNSNTDRIREYKALLDEGAITAEEYETKKKEILGL